MSKTQGQLVESARDRLDELVANRFADRQLRSWMNDGVRDIARRARWDRQKTTVAAVAGTQEYTAPATSFMIHALGYVSDGSDAYHDLISYKYRDVLAVSQTNLTISSSTPQIYWQWGTPGSMTFGVYPTPGEAGDFTVHYYAIPADLATDGTATTTAVSVPMGWEDCVVDYAVWCALKSARDQRWEQYKSDYIDNLTLLIELSTGDVFNDQAGRVVANMPSSPFGHVLDEGGWDW